MKNRRVGTISMAIVLIAMGVLIFVSQINQFSAIDMAFKLWPLTLVLLGIEILWAKYKSSDEGSNIKYDIFSVFIVFVILFVNIGMYGVAETGVMNIIKNKVVEQYYDFQLPNSQLLIDETIDKIIIEGFHNSNIKVRTSNNNKIVARASVSINANSEEEAKLVSESNIFKIEKIDNIVYIKYKNSYDYNFNDINISLPSSKKVEIKDGNQLDLVIDSLENNWIIDNVDNVKLRINKELDMTVSTELREEENLNGNVKWTSTKIGEEDGQKFKGELVYGEGRNKLNILNAYEVIADQI